MHLYLAHMIVLLLKRKIYGDGGFEPQVPEFSVNTNVYTKNLVTPFLQFFNPDARCQADTSVIKAINLTRQGLYLQVAFLRNVLFALYAFAKKFDF